jgi:hypothetical protein
MLHLYPESAVPHISLVFREIWDTTNFNVCDGRAVERTWAEKDGQSPTKLLFFALAANTGSYSSFASGNLGLLHRRRSDERSSMLCAKPPRVSPNSPKLSRTT